MMENARKHQHGETMVGMSWVRPQPHVNPVILANVGILDNRHVEIATWAFGPVGLTAICAVLGPPQIS